MESGFHAIFDRALMRRRRPAAMANSSFPDFLHRLAVDEIAFRLHAITRTFNRAVLTGAAGPVARAVIASDRIAVPILMEDARRADASLAGDLEALPFSPESLDAFIVALGLESVNDLPGTLVQIRRALKPDGLFLAVLLGGETLRELREAWFVAESETAGGVTPRVAPFADVRDLGGLLQRAGFALPVADLDRHTVRYADALALMRDLKVMGLANPLAARSRRPVTRTLLARAAAEYAARFSDPDARLRATFDLVTLTAWAPADTQPKPLKPGSATARLADVLGPDASKPRR